MLFHYLTASILIAQGLGHSLGFLAGWTSLPTGFRDRPWLFSARIRYRGWAGRLFGLLWLAAGLVFIISGFGLIFHSSAWPALALLGAGLSLLAILPWWQTVNPGPKLTAALVDLLLLAGLALPWAGWVIAALSGG